MGALLEEFKRELSVRQTQPGFNKEAFKTEFLESRGHKEGAREPGRGLPSRRLLPDVAASVAGGVTDAAEMWMRAIRAFDPKGGNDVIRNFASKGIKGIQAFVDKHPFLKPSQQADAGFRRAVTEGTRSFVQSASAVIPGMAASVAVPFAAPFVGAAGGAVVFGAAEKDRFEEEVENFISDNNLTETQATDLREKGKTQAIKSALVEGGFELAANTLQVMTLGLFRPFKGAAKSAVKTSFKSLFEQPGNIAIRAGKAYGKTAATEVATETAQEALETKFRRDIGITDMSSLDAAMSVIAPTLVTSLLFLGSAKGINSLDRRRIRKGLEDAGTDPKSRKKAVDSAVAVIGKKNKEQAEAIKASAYAYIDSGASIDLETEFGVLNFVGQMAKDLNNGALNVHDMEKFAQGIQGENAFISAELLKIATSYKIQNNIPDLGQMEQPGGEEDLAETILNPAKDVDLEAVARDEDDVADSPEVEDPSVAEKAVDEALEGKIPGANEDVPVLTDAELETELEGLKETLPGQEPDLAAIQQERIDAINIELGEREGEAAVQAERKKVLEEVEAPKKVELEPRVAEFKEPEPTKERKKAQREGLVEPVIEKTKEEKAKILEGLKKIEGEVAAEEVVEAPAEVPIVVAGEAATTAKEKVDVAAEQTDPTPTEAQIEAGNAKKGHANVQGLDISIETAEGQERSGTDLTGKPWKVTMKSHYGYIKGTKGRDKEHLDAFIGKNPGSENVFVVNQINPETGSFDEHKVMLGFDTEEAARAGYIENYAKGWKGLKSIVPMSMIEFKEWIKGDTTKELEAIDTPTGVAPEKEIITPVPVPKEKPVRVVPEAEKEVPPVPKEPTVTQKEVDIVSDKELDVLLEDVQPETKVKRPVSVTEKKEGRKPKATTKELKEKSAGDILSDATKSGVKGVESTMKGLFELFGGASLKSFPAGLDQETYATAKPHFEAAFTEFGKAGKSLKEFLQFMVNNFGNGIKPYLKFFVQEQRKPLEVPEEVAKPEKPKKPVEVGEPKAKVKTEKKETAEKKPRLKRERLKDVGEFVPGKRSNKDNFDRIKEEFKELETGNTNKDLNKILNRAVRSKIWKIEAETRPNASPGLIRYLKMVRDSAMGVTVYAADKISGVFESTSKARLEAYAGIEEAPGDRKGYNEIVGHVARYENSLEMLDAATSTAKTVQEAHDNIFRLVGDSTAKASLEKNQQLDVTSYLTEEGKEILNIFSWQDEKAIFRPASYIADEQAIKPEAKQLRRTRVSIKEMQGTPESTYRKDNPNPSAQDFIDKFGFRTAEFGEYVDSESGRRHINFAWDSLHALAEVLKMPINAGAVVKGEQALAMAFGARGRGRHAAHYEPSNHLINMTKNNGDGSLSHEWGHALDSALSKTKEGRDAVNDLENALEVKYDLEAARAEVEEILTGNSYWTQRTKSTPVKVAQDFLKSKWERYVKKSTDFTTRSKNLGEYWNRREEKFARAFEAYIYDSLTDASPYLVTSWVSGYTTTPENGYRSNPYPQEEEREQFNRIFKHFTNGIEWSKDGVPTMKKDYEFVAEKERLAAEAEMQKIADKLEDMFAAMHQGKASKDGLWWYKYTTTKRASFMQPKGINAHDDKFGENGAVGYTEALLPDDILYYKLKDVINDKDENKTYLKEKEDAGEIKPGDLLDTAGLEGEAALGEVEAEDGGGTETGAGVPRSIAERPGEISDSSSQPSESGGSREPSLRSGDADVGTATGGKGSPEVKSGQDAVLGGGNYRITESDRVGQGSVNEKFTNNIAAIRTLKQIEKEGRSATREEQAVLVKYVGWGGLSKAFDRYAGEGWTDKFEIVEQTLTEEEIIAARASTLSAFYTSPEIVSSMYDALQRFGFKGGRILEPAVGTGNFFGVLPESMIVETQLAGVEMDNISTRIARQLYQKATVFNSAYEKSQLPRNFYDVAVSNVPFEDTIPFDKVFNKKRFRLHDYYFTKTLELVRPGGIVAFITSAGTMDKLDSKARKVMADKADFIGAIRLPDTAFKDAGTKITADVIFLRRKGGEGKAVPEHKWIELDEEYKQKVEGKADETYKINQYFSKNPDMMLGQMSRTGRWEDSQSLMSDGRDIDKALKEAVGKLPENIYTEAENIIEIDIAELIPSASELIDGSFFEEGGKLFTHIPGQEAIKYEENTPHQKRKGKVIRSFIKLRGVRRELLKAQAKEEPEATIKKLTRQLNKDYDAFVKAHGFVNLPENLRAIIDDPEAPRILALENWNDETGDATKSDIFSKRFIQNLRPVESVSKPVDGIPHSLNTLGRIDIPFIANLSGVSEDEAIAEMQGEIWNDPERGWVISDEYLSGNIKEKIALAEQAAKTDDTYKKNIEALTPLIPEDLPPSKISANLGAPWIEPVDVQLFIRELIPSAFHIHVDYIPELGRWRLTPRASSKAAAARQHSASRQSVAATATWGTSRKNFFDLIDNILNGGLPTVRDAVPGTKPTQYILNTAQTDAAQAKLEAIKEKFSKWIWQKDDRVEKYVRRYNDVYNATRPRTWNGDHLTFPGKVPDDIITMSKHQKDAVWRAVSSGLNMYAAHEVGTGKTYVMAAVVMEAKRLGLKKKPMILGVKTNIDELAENFVKLYPAARVLRLDVSQNAIKRKIQLNRIANNEWDAVIITHDSFKNVQLSPAGQSEAMEEELGNLRLALAMAQEDGAASFTVKEIEKKIKKLSEKQEELQAQLNVSKIDLDFEELGVDMLVVDEAHEFKNVPYATRHSGIVGITGDGSQMAFDLHMKTRWINEKYGGGVIMASGTPITNSVAEIYNIGRYLNPQTLRDMGIHTFDAWAAAFGNITQTPEFAPEGGGYRMVRKFKEFVNIPELRSIVREVVDVVSVKDLDLKVPEILNGKPQAVIIPQNEMVEALGQEMLLRAKAIRGGGIQTQPRHPDKTDIMLSVISDGRNGAIDMRLVDHRLPDHKDTKANHAITHIFQSWKASKEINGTQLVFADRGVPSKGKLKKPFDVYNDIRDKLVAMGIPPHEIVFPRDVKGNKLKKKRLFNQVNKGVVRILIGSTEDMGIGVNVQERGVTIHNLDTEWTFEKLEQRRGRFVRQGNILYDFGIPVAVFNYMTEGTVDAFMWDKVAAKKVTTEVVLFGNSETRTVEDVSQEGVSAQEMMAFASGDPRFLHKIELEAEVRKLNAIRGNYVDEQYRLKRELQGIPGVILSMETGIKFREDAQKWFEPINAVKIGNVTYDLKRHAKEINERMAEVLSPKNVKMIAKSQNKIPIATYGHAVTEEIETQEELTDVNTVGAEEAKAKKKKINKVLRWEGNEIPIYVRAPFMMGEKEVKSVDDLKIGTKTKFGEYEMTASGGVARLLANTKAAMERETKEAHEIITKKEKERDDINEEITKPFEQEKEHTDKTLELANLTTELGQILQQQQEEQGKINPDLERFKSQAKDVGEMDVAQEDVSLSVEKKSEVTARESEYWAVTGKIAQAIVDEDDVVKEKLEKVRSKIEAELTKIRDVPAQEAITQKRKPTGVLKDIYNDLFVEAEKILGRGKAKLEVVTAEDIKKDPGVVKAAKELGITEEELIEEYNVKGAYQNVTVDGVAVRGVIKVAADGIRSIEDMKATVRHEIFHGVFKRLLNTKDRNIILERYRSEERAADAFAEHVTKGQKLVPVSVKTIFNRISDFFESLGNLLKGRGFKNAGGIFGAAAAGELADKQSTAETVGADVSLSIEKGVPEEDLNAEHDTSKEQFEKVLNSPNPLIRQYAQGLQNIVTMHPANVQMNKSHTKVVDEIYAGTRNTDIKFTERVFGLPWFLAKKFVEWKQGLGVELKRSEDRNLLISEFNKRVGVVPKGEKDLHEIMALKGDEQDGVLLAIYEGDARNEQFSDEALGKGLSLDSLGQLDKKYHGKVIKLSPKQVAAYSAWQHSMKEMRERVITAIDKLTYLPYESKPWVAKLKATVKNHELQRARQREVETAKGKRTDFSELQEREIPLRMKDADKKEFVDAFNKILPKQIRISVLRRQMGEIKGYAPRVREGKYVVKATDPEGRTLWHERTEKEKETRGMISDMIKRFEDQGFKHGVDFTVRKEVSDKASEFIFDQIQAVSVERFINKALNQAKTKDKISNADIEAVSEEMITLLTNEFKQRGFASTMMKRRRGFPIGGYKIENVKKRYAGYVSGASGYITKQVAAFEYANILRTIDINTKPDLYEDIARYSGDMLRNQTRLDRISGRVRTAAFVWYLAGQLKSPIVNFTQNWILGIPLLEKATGKGAKGIYHLAMADVARRKYTDQEKKFLKEMQERGITGDQLTQEITGQTVAESGKAYESVVRILAMPFSLSEIYNRKVSGLARFRTAIKAGDDYRTAFDKSRDFILDVHFLYGKLNAPSGARGGTPGAAILRTSLTFRNYTFNFLHAVKGMLSERDFKTFAKAMTYMALLGGASALPFLDGFLDILERITGIPFRKNAKKELEAAGGEILANVGIQGLPSLIGADIGGSLRIHFPDVTQPGKLIEESVFGVYEGLALKAVNSVKAATTGQFARAFELLSPTFIERPLKAIREREAGLTTTRGKIIKESTGQPIIPTIPETIVTALSFRPSRIARLSDNYRQFGNISRFYSDWRGDIYIAFRLAKTFEARQKVLQEVVEYNRSATDQSGAVSLIGATQLKAALRQRIDKRFKAFGG